MVERALDGGRHEAGADQLVELVRGDLVLPRVGEVDDEAAALEVRDAGLALVDRLEDGPQLARAVRERVALRAGDPDGQRLLVRDAGLAQERLGRFAGELQPEGVVGSSSRGAREPNERTCSHLAEHRTSG